MRYESIADIYSENASVRERLLSVLSGVRSDEAGRLPEDGGWSVQQIAEHLAIVNNGISRICAKLISAAKETGRTSDGSFAISPRFQQSLNLLSTQKAEAPDRVVPGGNIPVEDSVGRLAEAADALGSMRHDMERTDLDGHTFPHPYFGELTASEWLVVCGLHEARHTQQIERLLERIRR